VRKVLACLALKGVAYRIDPLVPFYGDDRFTRLSPLRRIPVLCDDQVSLCDSTVICEYLEDRYPQPPLLPATAAERARARWLEEYADTRIGDVLIWSLYDQRVIRRFVWGEAADEDRVRRALEVDIPDILDRLEEALPASGYRFGEIGLCDVALAAPFRNAEFAGFRVDPARHPLTAAYLERVLGHPALSALRTFETISLRTPIARHREALAEAGAPIAGEDHGCERPRPGLPRA